MSKSFNERESMVDLDKVLNSYMIPRMSKEASFMSLSGRKTTQRATLEAEQWFCGNEGCHLHHFPD